MCRPYGGDLRATGLFEQMFVYAGGVGWWRCPMSSTGDESIHRCGVPGVAAVNLSVPGSNVVDKQDEIR